MENTIAQNMMRRIAYGDCLRRTAHRYPRRVAVVDGEKRVTYRELNEMSNRFGNALLGKKLAKGTKVAFVGGNCLEHFIVFYGVAKAGMVFVPLNPLFKPEEMAFAVNNADCEVFVFNGMFLPFFKDALGKFEKVRHMIAFNPPGDGYLNFNALLEESSPKEVEAQVDGNDVLEILYTGGTTSFPRGAQLTHINVYTCTCGIAIDVPHSHNDVLLAIMPLFHVASFIVSLVVLLVGGRVVVASSLDFKPIMVAIEKEKVNITGLLSTLFRLWLAHPDFGKHDMSSLRLLWYFGAVMPEDLLKECMEKLCPNLCLSFGQTEMSPSTTLFKPEDQLRKIKSLGNSTVNVEVGVMDNDGNLLPPGQTGEFVYRSPQMMLGYYKNDAENREIFKYDWFHSGDLGYMDEENYVYFVDRKKDMIKSGGENVASIEVEKTIFLDPRVQEVYVVGLPHAKWAEAITAFVVPKPGQSITEEEIINLCKKHMVGFKVPKRVLFAADLPRSVTGKALKYQIKKQYLNFYENEA